jgi:hypothetical protein
MSERDDIKDRVKQAVNLADWVRKDGVPLTGGPNEFKARCPFHDDKSPSFTVFCKDGDWAFHCFGCSASGDVFEWIMRRRGCDFPEALSTAANSVGIALPEVRSLRPYTPPALAEPPPAPIDHAEYRALTPGSVACEYLTGKRKLPLELLRDYSVGETCDGLAYAFAYKWRPSWWRQTGPKFEFYKVVQVARPEGKKIERRDPKGGKSILFGMESKAVRDALTGGGELVICEGEIDAVTWAAYGFPAVSVPGGAGSLGWIDLCYEWLAPWRKIHISFDEDRAGRLKVVEIVKRLGMARTDIVRLKEVPAGEAETQKLRKEQA